MNILTNNQLAVSQASIQSLYTSKGSDSRFIVVWKSSKQTLQVILAVLLDLSLKKKNLRKKT